MLHGGTAEAERATERFEALLDRCERLRAAGLPFDELGELGRLYRLHLARLARLRERDDDRDAIRHLNALSVRAHTFLYVPASAPRGLGPLVREWLPDALGRTWRAQVLAWALLLGGAVVGGVLAARDPRALHALIPPSMCHSPEHLDDLARSPAARAAFLAREETPAALNALFGSALFANNTRVGLLAFATGMLAGVPTVLLQLFNGMMVGAFAAIFLRDPWPLDFLAWILPHGIPELTAVTLSAAGGLVLGGAVAAPGRAGRRAALAAAVGPALLLVGAALPLFAAAALVESFVRESTLGTAPRLGLAAAFAAGLAAALVGVRRLATRTAVDTGWLGEIIGPRRGAAPGSGSAPPPSSPPASDPASGSPAGAAA